MYITPLTRYDYLRISIALIPDEIIQKYNMLPLVRNGFIYLDICKVVYGFPQVGCLSNYLLTKILSPKGYFQCTHTPGLWRHPLRPILFSLVLDNFVVKYVGKEHTDHLISSIGEFYPVAEDWNGSLHCVITLNLDYQK